MRLDIVSAIILITVAICVTVLRLENSLDGDVVATVLAAIVGIVAPSPVRADGAR